ncbi:MAG: TonB-dependent receptor, partial [Lysobacterales bacterium]
MDMTRGRWVRSALVGLAALVLLPAAASAQSRIAGAVTDTSGGALPGVTVEAASPVLIEKVRAAVTDGRGQYTIIDLRPGTYDLTFTLPGFASVRSEGIVLPADFTATVNAQLSVGAIEETVTVTGQSPLVDVQSAARTQVVTRELLDALPTPRNTQSLGYLAQGVRLSKPDVGGAQMMEQVNMRVHGSSQVDTTMQIDGMLVSPAFNDGAIQNYINQAAFGEISFTTSSQSADVQAGGIRQNLIPLDGGNRFSGSNYFGGSLGSWQANNLTPELISRGVSLPTGITHIYDINPAVGGPLLRDRLWFFGSMRWMSVDEKVLNSYLPDGSQAVVDQLIQIPMVRLTFQATPRNKISAYLDRPFKFKGHEFTFGIEPSRASRRRNPSEANYHNFGSKWTSTVTNRALLEVGFNRIVERLHSGYQPDFFPSTQGYPRPADIHLYTGGPNIDPWFSQVSHWDISTTQRTVATTGYSGTLPDRNHFEAAITYVPGSHSVKTGFQWNFGQDRNDAVSNGDLTQQNYRRGVPESVVVNINPFATEEYVKADIGLYVTDTWTMKRLTVTPGVRYDYLNSQIKEQWRAEGRFVPGQ